MPLPRLITSLPRSAAVLALLAVACDDGDVLPIVPDPENFALTPVAITVVPGDTVRLRLTGLNRRDVRAIVLGSSSTAASVDTAGLVTAVSPGTSVVTVTVHTRAGRAASVSVPVTVLGVTLTPARAVVAVGGAVTLRPEFAGPAAAYGTLPLTSSDTTIATVAPDGTVRGVRPGIVRITLAASVDRRVRAESEIVVAGPHGFPIGITVQPNPVVLRPGATQQLAVTVPVPADAPANTPRGVRFASSDTSVATVSDSGLITGRRDGTAVITVAALYNPLVTQFVSVTVRDFPRNRLTIQAITSVDSSAPVDLNAVRGKVRVAVNFLDEAFDLRRAELWLAGRRAASRDSLPAGGNDITTFTLDVDTAERDSLTGARVYPNGAADLEVRLAYVTPGTNVPQSAVITHRLTLANP